MSFFDKLFPKVPQEETSIGDRLPDDPVRNGIHAEQLLADPLLKQCFENVKQAYLKRLETIPAGNVEGLTMLQLSLIALADARRSLLTYHYNGQQAIAKQNGDRVSRPNTHRMKNNK